MNLKQPMELQRAFLQTAVQQNIQIQQQLIQQNNALQQLLKAPNNAPTTSNIPPPPPLPDQLIDHGSRPFVDPYGRAKTVRIGKWRWPPSPSSPDNFTEFKQRQEAKSNIIETTPAQQQQIPVIKVARPFGEMVGKLKISSEMREKLEQVTSSVRGGDKKRSGIVQEEIVIKKIGEDRKSMLAEKLGGASSSGGGVPPPPPPPVMGPPKRIDMVDNNNKMLPPPPPPVSSGLNGGMNGMMMISSNQAPFFTYNRVPWIFRLRKEVSNAFYNSITSF